MNKIILTIFAAVTLAMAPGVMNADDSNTKNATNPNNANNANQNKSFMDSAKDTASSAADSVSDTAKKAAKSTKEAASSAADKVQDAFTPDNEQNVNNKNVKSTNQSDND